MTDGELTTVAERLRTRSPKRLWGLSPESVYTALAARSANDSLTDRLSTHVRAEMLRTNGERDPEDVARIHDWILKEFDLVNNGEPTLLGMVILAAEEPQQLVRAIAVNCLRMAEVVLRSCNDIEESLPRREFDSLLADDWEETVLGSLLGSLGFVTSYPDSVEPHHERIESALNAQDEISEDTAIAEAYRRILPQLVDVEEEQCLEDIVEQVTGVALSEDTEAMEIVAALVDAPTVFVDPDELDDAIDGQRKKYDQEFQVLRPLLAPTSESTLRRVDTSNSVDESAVANVQADDGSKFLVNVLATISAHSEFEMFDVQFLTDRLSMTPYAVYRTLSAIPGVNCKVRDEGVIEFDSVPLTVDGDDLREEYTSHLLTRCSKVQQRINALSDVSVSTSPEPVALNRIVAEDYASLDNGDVAPAYFTYTLVDPDVLGEKKMDAYVDDSRGLGRERAQLRRWHKNQPPGLRSYTAMTDRLFSLGLERELDSKILRIMTPFDDDTFNEYVSQIRRLLEQGFELRLLTRHTKEEWEWRRLQRNLLSEIKDHRNRVTVHTYSRFKEYQRVRPEMDFQNLGEFGIHGKLQTIGQPEEGAALLGSANFMENSYDWNPECGVYTERTQFVDAAIEFFDIVWNVSEADELSIERLQEIPDRQLVPTYYS
ncbi:phospholipase D-like domain-containing protein [Halocatena marina]|uniref:phospholipase D-like domain-containing protein n=1 Tax=Halocatena marina TaxID=2934937 RepID=UPI0020109817|nr:phospholipase D-like domain-containing protein [Halocatena marina]